MSIAAVDTQNQLSLAEPRLPSAVIQQGLTVKKASTNMLMVATLQSNNTKYDELYLNNYATIFMLDKIKRVPGVGDASLFGAKDYSIRVWVDSNKMAARGITVKEISAAIQEQNNVYPAGRIGANPDVKSAFTFSVIAKGRMSDPKEFGDIVLRTDSSGSVLRLKDVARIELGSQSYDMFGRHNGISTALIPIYLQSGANALDTAMGVRKALEELSRGFPDGVFYKVPHDTSEFIKLSIDEVVHTLFEAILLVILVVYVFLGNLRAVIIPVVAVPVSIIGTFIGILALGFTINSLTLFALVLAIGIVVDDAIVVVENVERIMTTDKLPPREATIKAMEEVTGPIIAIVLVLSAVFLPVAFLGGLTGQMYRQFAVTIAISVAISGLVALTLSPALCRLLLKSSTEHTKKLKPLEMFDKGFNWVTKRYTNILGIIFRHTWIALGVFGVIILMTGYLFMHVPSGLIPEEDQGYFLAVPILPTGASIERTDKLTREIEKYAMSIPEVRDVIVLGGFDFLSGGVASSNSAALFIVLKPWAQRTGKGQDVWSLIGKFYGHFMGNKDGLVLAFNTPPVPGLGTRSGFELQLQARGGQSLEELNGVAMKFLGATRNSSVLTDVRTTITMDQPQIFLDVDTMRAKLLGLSMADVYTTLQAYMGDLYVNDFDVYGRLYRVEIRAEGALRQKPEDLLQIYVKNNLGTMVPISGFTKLKMRSGPNIVTRFNSYPSYTMTGVPKPGFSTGDSMKELLKMRDKFFPAGSGYDFEWSGASYQEVQAGNQAPYVMAFGLLVVFLVLAAQYEKWSLPFAVLLIVPFGAFGAISAVWIRGLFDVHGGAQDIYFQIGLLTLIGLAAKNAILIVEFCAALHDKGKGLMESALRAGRLRLRPIVMTSLAFILGVLPLVISKGAGAIGRHSIGTGVMGGMIAATFLAVFFVPLFYVIVQGLANRFSGRK